MVEIRKAETSDINDLVELRAEMFQAMGVLGEDESWRQNAHRWFAERLEDPRYGFFVLDLDGVVVACAAGAVRDAAPSPANPDGRDVLISNVCTDPKFRGQGYGRAVFAVVMDWARMTGVARAELMATAGGQRIYENVGFHPAQHPAMRASLL